MRRPPPKLREPIRVTRSTAGKKLLLMTLLTGAGLTAGGTAATVYAAGDVQRRESAQNGSAATSVQDITRQWRPILALADSLTASVRGRERLDSAYLRTLVALVAAPGDSLRWIAHATTSFDERGALATVRRLAYIDSLPAFWGARSPAPNDSEHFGVPGPRLQILKRAFNANVAEADSSLVHGDTADALLRARENVAAARQLFAQPRVLDALVGRTLLRDASKLLARAALQAQEPSLHSAALRLQNGAQALDIGGGRALLMGGASVSDEQLLALARDRKAHPASRLLAVEKAVAAACLNTRDVLFGPSAERFQLVDGMIADLSDIPRANELRRLYDHRLSQLAHDPSAILGREWKRSTINEPLSEALLRLVVPARVQARIDVCRVIV